MLTIHHLTRSRSERIVWLMEELGLEYRIPEASESPVRARVADRMARMLAFVDEQLESHHYFAGGEFTAADVMMVFSFTTVRYFLDYDLAPYANIQAYLKRIEARPAYRKAMAIAGPEVTT